MSHLNIIRQYFNLPQSADKYWNIITYDEFQTKQIYLLRYKKELLNELYAEKFSLTVIEKILSFRGLIITIENKNLYIITGSYSYTPVITTYKQIPINADIIELKDNITEQIYHIDFTDPNTSMIPFFEGPIIRISKYQNQIYMSTSKHLDIKYWSQYNMPSLSQLYEKYNGPDPKLFFGTEPTSNVTHLIMIVNGRLMSSSKLNVGYGYLLYLGYLINDPNKNYNINIHPHVASRFSTAQFKGINEDGYEEFCAPQPPPTNDQNNIIIKPTILSNEHRHIANILLISGYSGYYIDDLLDVDPRLTPGESILIKFKENDKFKMIKLSSVAYEWRKAITQSNSNLYFIFFNHYSQIFNNYFKKLNKQPSRPDSNLLELGTPLTPGFNDELVKVFNGNPKNLYTYTQLFPYLATPTIEELKRYKQSLLEDPLIYFMPEYFTILDTRTNSKAHDDLKIRNIAANILLAAPIAYVLDAVDFYEKFLQEKNDVINYLVDNYLLFKSINSAFGGLIDNEKNRISPKLSDYNFFMKMDKQELNVAARALIRLYEGSFQETNKRKPGSLDDYKQSLRNFLNKEFGVSLYNIIQAINKYRKYTNNI